MKKENFEHSKIDDLSDTMFKLIEDISDVEDKIEETKKDIKALVESFESNLSTIKETQTSQAEVIEKLNNNDITNIINKVVKLETNINSIVDSGLLNEVSSKINNKIMLKKEISKWQMIMIGILIFLGLESLFFFIFVFNSATQGNALIALFIAVLPFIIAMYFINNNLKKLISEEKIIPKYNRNNARRTNISQPTSITGIKDNDEVKGTFD
ncbi:hypothetical protein [Helicobacter sp. MIT 14-3879]|uniref:hypothetical protein n=1 Tax=Helicobacter sp. MIT 14-3879 TaxID=2040649 RepID=UPI000E1EA0ED|nr:hypothetical protein [Helicobacter sp. MIT 14-3879]RDU63985.1 hypothetical protein CQA44_04920 [Helicobacter sp. MIT 14-3879]